MKFNIFWLPLIIIDLVMASQYWESDVLCLLFDLQAFNRKHWKSDKAVYVKGVIIKILKCVHFVALSKSRISSKVCVQASVYVHGA